MSEQSGGPGWWMASDGRWYPPQQSTMAPTATAPPPAFPPQPGPVPPPYGYAYAPGPSVPSNGAAVAALVLGIIGVLSGLIPLFFFFAWIFGVLALVFGLVGRGRARRGFGRKGQATAGTIMGGASIVLGVIGVVLIASVFSSVSKHVTVNPGDVTVEQSSCNVDESGVGTASGTLTNNTNSSKLVVVDVDFDDGSGQFLGRGSDIETIDAGGTTFFSVTTNIPDGGSGDVTCSASAS